MRKQITAMMIAVMLVLALSTGAVAADSVLDGWESWNPRDFYGEITLRCPDKDVSVEEILYYLEKLYSEHRGDDKRVFILDFPVTRFNTTDEMLNWAFGDLFNAIESMWPYKGAIHSVTVNPQESNVSRHISLYFQINAVSDEAVQQQYKEKVRSIASAARNSSSSVEGQLSYVNQYLVDNVVYGEGDIALGKRVLNGFGALIDGVAVCEGYTNAFQDICWELGIPCVNVHGIGHVWNSVYVNGQWKFVDVTWNDVPGRETEYFLVNDIVDLDGGNSHQYNSTYLAWGQRVGLLRNNRVQALSYITENGIMQGDAYGNLNLNSSLTRAELAVLIVRINGMSAEVESNSSYYATLCPFTDVADWAKPSVGYCVNQGILSGYSASVYGAGDPVTPQAACTVMLRNQGYAETDWSYETACQKAASLGWVSQYYPTGTKALRGDIVEIIYNVK